MAQLQRVGIGAVMLPNEPTSYEPPEPKEPRTRPLPIEVESAPTSAPPPIPAPPAPAPIPAPIPPPLPPLPLPIPTVPYPTPPPIPVVPQVAATWLRDHAWIAPVGGGVLALLLGLTIGIAVGRRQASPA